MEYLWLTPALTMLSVVIIIWLVRKYDNPMYKITWILVIVLLPLFGGLFYLVLGQYASIGRVPSISTSRNRRISPTISYTCYKGLIEHPRHAARARYIETLDGMLVWTNTETKYFRVGEEIIDSICE